MFTLVFLVMFGPKKGSNVAYSGTWGFNLNKQLSSLKPYTGPNKLFFFKNYFFKFQFTAITSRLTSYFLFSFWLFFFFFGETLLLLVLNFTTTIDTINSASFMIIKKHMIFFLLTTSVKLTTHINVYIYFLTSCAFFYMMNLSYSYSYRYLSKSSLTNYFISFIFLLFVFYSLF